MIDRQARLQGRKLLERWLRSDGLTNYQLEDAWPHSADEVLRATPAMLFQSFNGYPEQPLNFAILESQEQELIKRTHLFLYTELEYTWPVSELSWLSFGFWESILWKVFKLRSKRASNRRATREALFSAHGDFSVWPFISRDSYDLALASEG